MRLFLARLALALAVFGVGQVALASDVGAAGPRAVSGTWVTSAPAFNGVHPAGINIQLFASSTARFVGDFGGTTLFTGKFIFDPQGNIRGHATEAFAGTVSGVGSGTVLFQEETTVSAAGVVHVDATITHGTGDLAHLSGRLIFDGTSAVDLSSAGTFVGQIQT
jgi:hypothetical protein